MSIIKFFNNANQKSGDLTKKIAYVGDYNATHGVVRGVGTGKINPCLAMELVKLAYKKTENRQYIHLVYSPDPDLLLSSDQIYDISYQISKETFSNFQVFYGIHSNTNHLHTHFVINAVSFKSGYMFQQSKKQLADLKKVVHEIERRYGLATKECSIESVSDEEDLDWMYYCSQDETDDNSDIENENSSHCHSEFSALNCMFLDKNYQFISFTDQANSMDFVRDKGVTYKPIYSTPFIEMISKEPSPFMHFVENSGPNELIEVIDSAKSNTMQVLKNDIVIGVIYKEDKNDL